MCQLYQEQSDWRLAGMRVAQIVNIFAVVHSAVGKVWPRTPSLASNKVVDRNCLEFHSVDT